jgi:gluconolactonase
VAIYNPDARLIGRILLPERCANLCFGGAKRNRLFLAASQSLYSIFVNTQGVAGG